MSACLVTLFIIYEMLHLKMTEEKMVPVDRKMNVSSK